MWLSLAPALRGWLAASRRSAPALVSSTLTRATFSRQPAKTTDPGTAGSTHLRHVNAWINRMFTAKTCRSFTRGFYHQLPKRVEERMSRSCAVAVFAVVTAICCAAQKSAPDQQITLKDLVIKGANDLSFSQIAEAKASVVGKPSTTEHLMDTARLSLTASLKSECYLNPDIELFSAFRKDGPPDDVVMYATVHENLRYTLRN